MVTVPACPPCEAPCDTKLIESTVSRLEAKIGDGLIESKVAEMAESQGREEATTSSFNDEAREAEGLRRSREVPQMAVRKLPSPWRPRIAVGVAYGMPTLRPT